MAVARRPTEEMGRHRARGKLFGPDERLPFVVHLMPLVVHKAPLADPVSLF